MQNIFSKNIKITKSFTKILNILLILILSNCIFTPHQEYFPGDGEAVLILHGIKRTNTATYQLARDISKAGFEVYNISYPSQEYTIEELADYIYGEIQRLGLDQKPELNIVAHSLGGLIIRAYLNLRPMDNIGRVVMISTPNKGSQVADYFQNVGLYQKIFGPAGQQLITDQTDLACISDIVYYELGIIAGTRSFNPFFSEILEGTDDGVVAVKSTKLEGMTDFITIPSLHGSILRDNQTAKQVVYFLKYGKFYRKPKKEK